MILDISSCITFFPLQNKYQGPRSLCQHFGKKRFIDKQKEQVADKIKRDIFKYLVKCEVVDGAWYHYVYNISPCAK